MSERELFGRILVALDASSDSLIALDTAVDFAAAFGAELCGLFVEDVSLLELAKLPVASEVASFSGSIEPLDAERMRLQLRAVAERARRALADCAARAHVPWSFRVSRGPVSAAVLEAVGGGDLVTLGRIGWSSTSRAGFGSTARAILAEAQASALVSRRKRRKGGSVCAIYDGSDTGRRTLDVIARLARGVDPTILLIAADEETADRFEREAKDRLLPRGVRAVLRRLVGADRKAIVGALESEAPSLLALPAEIAALLGDLLEPIESSILVVRNGA